jgi:hypothetical protein
MSALARYEILTARELRALVGADLAEVADTLEALVHEGLLERLHPHPGLKAETPAPAYALSRLGVRELRRLDGHGERPVVLVRRSPFTLAHDLERNAFGVVLELLAARGHFRLLRFETARSRIADVAHLLVAGEAHRIPLVADGLAVLEVDGQRTGLLVEIDRGTVAARRMEEKYRGYHAWWREGGPHRRFGIQSLRVLTVVPHKRRLRQLHAAALDATMGRGSGLLWFGESSLVNAETPEELLTANWTVARCDPAPEPLFTMHARQGVGS